MCRGCWPAYHAAAGAQCDHRVGRVPRVGRWCRTLLSLSTSWMASRSEAAAGVVLAHVWPGGAFPGAWPAWPDQIRERGSRVLAHVWPGCGFPGAWPAWPHKRERGSRAYECAGLPWRGIGPRLAWMCIPRDVARLARSNAGAGESCLCSRRQRVRPPYRPPLRSAVRGSCSSRSAGCRA